MVSGRSNSLRKKFKPQICVEIVHLVIGRIPERFGVGSVLQGSFAES